MFIMKISLKNGVAKVESPYNPNFISAIKKIGGKWDADSKTWDVDERNVDIVRKVMKKIYGIDDITTPKLVSVRVRVLKTIEEVNRPITIFGKVIASVQNRDSGAKIGEDVAFEALGPEWCTVIPEGAILLIHDVPEDAVQNAIDCYKDEYIKFEIVGINKIDHDTLIKERARLSVKISEIDEALAECGE
jgi:hypothetical protein